MIRTPSLRRRVLWLGVPAVILVVLVTEVFLFLSMKSSLLANLEHVLDDRARLVAAEAAMHDPPALADRLTQLGIRATVTAPDGSVYQAAPPSPFLGDNLAPQPSQQEPVIRRDVALPGRGTAMVFARRSGTDDALRKLLLYEALGLVLATAIATLVLWRMTGVALDPLRKIAESARRTSSGQRGVRLDPDQPDTHLGRLAVAHDEMVAALEQAIRDADEARERSEELRIRARKVIETATAAFVSVDADGMITDWNAAAERTFGWKAADVVGEPAVRTIFPPELGSSPFDEFSRASSGGAILDMPVESSALHQDGHVFSLEATVWSTPDRDQPVYNAFLQDITKRREGEEAGARLAAIVDAAQEAIFSNALDGTILTWNRGAELLYGFTASEVVGSPDTLLVPGHRADEARGFAEQVAQGEPVSRHETVRRCKNATEVEVALTISPIRSGDGTIVGASTIARDISEQRWMAQALNSMIEALQEALDDARLSEELSRRFLADAAHQLRTPIAGIRACAETLLRGTGPEARDRLLADVVRETARASRLMQSLLRLARLDRGEGLSTRPSDLVALCRAEADRARVLAPDLNISVHVVGPPPPAVPLDDKGVQEIVANLLDNARRHAVTRVDVMIRTGDGDVEVGVTDDGFGVAADAVDRIFERFVSLDGKGGSGLGLPIARELARAHGGDLAYRSKVFVLTLPTRSEHALDRAAAS